MPLACALTCLFQGEEDITISFKPKVQLHKGSTVSQVRLVLADFEGADADYIKLESIPVRAFIGAYWTSKTKELALILGDDVPAHTPVTINIPASSGIRRMQINEKSEASESSPSDDSIVPREDLSALSGSEQTQTSMPSEETTQESSASTIAAVVFPTAAAPAPSTSNVKNASPVQEDEPEKQYGIDMDLIWSESEEAFVVAEIVRGGAAWKNGLINEGNVVTHVDEETLTGKSVHEVARLLLGAPSTAVVLTVRDHVDPLSGQVQTRDVKVIRYDTVEMTIDFYDEEEFCDIPEVEEVQSDAVSQAEWARRQLAQAPKEVTKMVDLNDISKKVSDQSKAAKEKLQSRSSIVKTEYDAESVAEQARWAKDRLDNRKDTTQRTVIDAEMVAEQKSSALAALANLPQKQVDEKFDAQSVADQAKWAKKQLENRPDNIKSVAVDAASVSEQAQWAKKKLLAKEQGLGDESTEETFGGSSSRNQQQQCTAPANTGASDALDELCKLAGLDDLPNMGQVLAAVANPAEPTLKPAATDAVTDEEKEEKKRRAMQKRLDFLAQQAASTSANDSTTGQELAQPASAQHAVAAPGPPEIVLAPSPLGNEAETRESSPSPDEPRIAQAPTNPQGPAPSAPTQQLARQPEVKPRTSSLSGRAASDSSLNSSALPPPSRNFCSDSTLVASHSRGLHLEEELQFRQTLSAKKVVA